MARGTRHAGASRGQERKKERKEEREDERKEERKEEEEGDGGGGGGVGGGDQPSQRHAQFPRIIGSCKYKSNYNIGPCM